MHASKYKCEHVTQKSQVERMEHTTGELSVLSQLQHRQHSMSVTSLPLQQQAVFDACDTTTFC